jgi:V8-like Glu-specific endopeptidase
MLRRFKARSLVGLKLRASAVCGVCLATAVVGATAATSGASVVGGVFTGAAAHTAGIANTANGRLSTDTAAGRLFAGADPAAASTDGAAHVRLDNLSPDTDGPVVVSPTTAPWSVLLFMEDSDDNLYQCSGSIISTTQILTAGHCTYDESEGGQFATGDYLVAVGTANANVTSSTQELDTVSAVRETPGYVFDGATGAGDPYDVAELTLSTPLQFNAGVQPIPVVGQGREPAVGTGMTFYGWGESATDYSDSYEHTLTSTLIQPWVCASGQPSVLCSLSAADDACPGDSGSGLIVTGVSPVLIGVADYTYQSAQSVDCGTNDPTGYADLASAALAQWLAGSGSQTLGPTTSGHAQIADEQPLVGSTATCSSPAWSGSPNVSFLFIDGNNNVLQTGSSTYTVPQSELGQTISCVAVATNAGGTADAVSELSTGTIESQAVPGLTINVTIRGAVTATSTAGSQGPTLTLTATLKDGGAVRFSRAYPGVASLSATLNSLQPGAYSVCVASADRGPYASASECVNWVHDGAAASYLGVRARNLRGRPAIVVTTQSPIRGDRAIVTWVGKSARGQVRIIKRVRLRAKATLRAPATAHVRWLDATVGVQGNQWQGAAIEGGSRHVRLP